MPTILDLTWVQRQGSGALPTAPPYKAPAIYRGDGYSLRFLLADSAGAPYEPQGALTAQIRRDRLERGEVPGAPLAEFTVAVLGNEVLVSLDETQTAGLPSKCAWDLQEVIPGLPPTTWFTGEVKVWGDVTRPAAP